MIKPLAFLSLLLALPLTAESGKEEPGKEAAALVKSLSPDQKELALFPLKSDERENWHYVPMERKGIRIDALNAKQRKLAHQLLEVSIGEQGHLTARQIMSLEQVLRDLGGDPDYRDPEKYFVAIFGEPETGGFWGWRFEGHHLSLNFTLEDGKTVLTTPFFFGTNPAEVREGKLKGLRPLGEIEDAARDLARQLHQAGLHVRFTNKPPKEILTGQDRKAERVPEEGVPATKLDESQRKSLLALTETIAKHQRFLGVDAQAIEEARFGWAGSFKKGDPHYFRIQTPEFLVEYANTQNKANHAHLVWRDFKNDFGRDLLREHFEKEH